jgi:hypothetical protein
VRPGVTPRDLRRAYHRLIRRYKPEHAQEAFRRVREAYETVLSHFTQLDYFWDPAVVDETDDEAVPSGARGPEQDTARQCATVLRDHRVPPWELACQGKLHAAYAALREEVVANPHREELYLQLYWLHVVDPSLSPMLSPAHWLIEGLLSVPRHGVLLEVIRQAVDAEPARALADGFATLLGGGIPGSLRIEAAGLRWRAARLLNRVDLITADLSALRVTASGTEETVWLRLLITAATQIAWCPVIERDALKRLGKEIEQLGHGQLELSDELFRLDFLQEVATGWRLLKALRGPMGELRRLLPLTWDEPVSDAFPMLRDWLDQVAPAPRQAIGFFDRLNARSGAVLAHVSQLIGRMNPAPETPRPAACGRAVMGLLSRHRWWQYARFRLRLLEFCLAEAIAPEEAARALAELPELCLEPGKHLAAVVSTDWPLIAAYQACELALS